MHPFIKIVCLLVIISMLVALSPIRVMVVAIALLLLVLFKGKQAWQAIKQMSWRMKWLWLSLLILYGWFLPGAPVFFSDAIPLFLIPSVEGLTTGGLRALVLLNIIIAVVLIIKSTSKEALIVSIMWLMTPFRLLKVDTGKFAARLVLTMEQVTTTEKQIRHALQETGKTSYLTRGIDVVARLLVDVEKQAEQRDAVLVELPHLDAPGFSQWLIPVGLFVVLYMI